MNHLFPILHQCYFPNAIGKDEDRQEITQFVKSFHYHKTKNAEHIKVDSSQLDLNRLDLNLNQIPNRSHYSLIHVYVSIETTLTSPTYFYVFNSFVSFSFRRSNFRYITPQAQPFRPAFRPSSSPNLPNVPLPTRTLDPQEQGFYRPRTNNDILVSVLCDPQQIQGLIDECLRAIHLPLDNSPANLFLMERANFLKTTPFGPNSDFAYETNGVFNHLISNFSSSSETIKWRNKCSQIILDQTLSLHMASIYSPPWYDTRPPNPFIYTI